MPMNAAQRLRHKEMITTPDNWPRWPHLPLKKSPFDPSSSGIGYLYGDPPKDGTFTVYVGGNMYHPTLGATTKTYPDVDALLDDGWIVD